MRIADPGGNVLKGYRPATPSSGLPLTHVASEAMSGRHGDDLGVFVPGAGVGVRIGRGLRAENPDAHFVLYASSSRFPL